MTNPELVVHSWRIFLDEGSIIGCYVPVVAVLLQHVDLGFNLLLLILKHTNTETNAAQCQEHTWYQYNRKAGLKTVCVTHACDIHDLDGSELASFDMATLKNRDGEAIKDVSHGFGSRTHLLNISVP